jgi:divalent metal cation (Fe/Co/Zn/Cd) transporter
MSDPQAVTKMESSETRTLVLRLQWFSVIWMTVEAAGGLLAAWQSHSTALLAFGGDSLIELFSATLVLFLAFRPAAARSEQAGKLASGLLVALAGTILFAAYLQLAHHVETGPTGWGIAILAASALLMPWLAHRKRRLARITADGVLRADAAQSAVCGSMAWIALAGLLLQRSLHFNWADPVAALLILPFILQEAREAWSGQGCTCGC